MNGAPYVVVSADFLRMQQRKPVMQTKLKNLIDGKALEVSFHPGDRVEEADLEHRKANYQYKDDLNVYLMDNTSFEQFSLSTATIGDKISFLKEGTDVDVLYFEGNPVTLDIPAKIVLKVVETPPGIKGDTATGGTKAATLETGYVVQVPLFIKEGDMVKVNTESGTYTERA